MTAAGGTGIPCLDDGIIADLADGRVQLQPAWEAHFADCDECRRVFAAVARGRASPARSGS